MRMIRALLATLAALVWTFASPALAESRLFSDDAPLQMTITAPFRDLLRTAKTKPVPYPATAPMAHPPHAAVNVQAVTRQAGMRARDRPSTGAGVRSPRESAPTACPGS